MPYILKGDQVAFKGIGLVLYVGRVVEAKPLSQRNYTDDGLYTDLSVVTVDFGGRQFLAPALSLIRWPDVTQEWAGWQVVTPDVAQLEELLADAMEVLEEDEES